MAAGHSALRGHLTCQHRFDFILWPRTVDDREKRIRRLIRNSAVPRRDRVQ